MSKSVTSPDPNDVPSSSPPPGSSPLPFSSSPPPVAPPPRGKFPEPQNITGGCLCGMIRYNVEFPPGHDFSKSSNSCQCTQCRKHTGALIFYTHTIPKTSMQWQSQFLVPLNIEILDAPSMVRYHRTASGYRRGFCPTCGSTLYWEDEKRTDLELAIGTVDAEFLIGSYGEPGRATATAPPVPTADGYGYALANCSGVNEFCENEIKGVTDGLTAQQRGSYWHKHAAEEHMNPMP